MSLLLNKQDPKYLKYAGFNAGFYITSKYHFEEESLKKFISRLISYQKKNRNLKHGTQTILNLLTINNIELIDSKWNEMVNKENFKIFHWHGLSKPWKSNDKLWLEYKIIYDKFIKLNKEKTTLNINY